MYSNVIVIGSIAYDDIMDFPGEFKDHFLPKKLHQINISFVVDKLEKQLGGTGLNIAYNVSLRIFRNDIFLLGSVGKDGDVFLEFCRKNEINTEGIVVDNNLYTATGKVITDKKDNQIWGFYYGASVNGEKIDLKKYADKKNLVVISANHPKAFLHFQKQAIEIGCDYLYDPGMALTWIKKEDLEEGVRNCKWLVGNDYEIARIKAQVDVKGCEIITTLGAEGVEYVGANFNSPVLKIKSYPVKKVVDPTGAGDAWRGGFIAAIIQGKKIEDALKLGNVMASFAIEKYGTVNHKPSFNEIINRLNKI